jgi:hypothetical protein
MPHSTTSVSDNITSLLAAGITPSAIQSFDLFATLLADADFRRAMDLLPGYQHHHGHNTPWQAKLPCVNLLVEVLSFRAKVISYVHEKIVDLKNEDHLQRGPDDSLLVAITILMGLDVSISVFSC